MVKKKPQRVTELFKTPNQEIIMRRCLAYLVVLLMLSMSSSFASSLDIPSRGKGISFGNSKRFDGLRLNLVDRGVDPNKIIFFSFTKAATEELRERVEAVGIKVRDSKKKVYDGATITTFTTFTP